MGCDYESSRVPLDRAVAFTEAALKAGGEVSISRDLVLYGGPFLFAVRATGLSVGAVAIVDKAAQGEPPNDAGEVPLIVLLLAAALLLSLLMAVY